MSLHRVTGADIGLPGLPGAAELALRVVLRSIQSGQPRRLRKPFQSFCEFVNRFFGTQAQKTSLKIFSGICSRFLEGTGVFLFQGFLPLFHNNLHQGFTGELKFKEKSTKLIVMQEPPEGEGK